MAINFANSSDFSQEASGAGFGAKLGMTFKLNEQLTFGGAYHLKTAMSDWEGDAEMVMYAGDNEIGTLKGDITIDDFQWPATLAAGVAFTPNDRTLLVADAKLLQWSDVMEDFTMKFDADADTDFQIEDSDSAEITLYQDWDDQLVFSLGGAYQINSQLVVRAGYNYASNPVPDEYVHPLFPAIVEQHYTAGVGFAITRESAVNFSLTHAPEVTVTNSNTEAEISHAQTNWQLAYSHRF